MQFTFETTCCVTVSADSEAEARRIFQQTRELYDQDVHYGPMTIYLPIYDDFALLDVYPNPKNQAL